MSRDISGVLAAIDGALGDGFDGEYVSEDEMRWAPPWDEPVVAYPDGLVEELLLEGCDGYAAAAYVDWQLRLRAEYELMQWATRPRQMPEVGGSWLNPAVDALLDRIAIPSGSTMDVALRIIQSAFETVE